MFELTTDELKHIITNMHGFSGRSTIDLCDKITAEIERRSELESLDFEDCDGCKL